MTRGELVLALLAAGNGRAYSPAQLQKAAFLVTRNMPQIFAPGQAFDFQPYDYGPFDKQVYEEAQLLRHAGDADISPSGWGRWVLYSATQQGINSGRAFLEQLPQATRDYIVNLSQWVLAQSFTSLVKYIYAQYPEMRANSIFRD